MNVFNEIWGSGTSEFSLVQKIIIAVVLTIIFCVALLAIVLLAMEIME